MLTDCLYLSSVSPASVLAEALTLGSVYTSPLDPGWYLKQIEVSRTYEISIRYTDEPHCLS